MQSWRAQRENKVKEALEMWSRLKRDYIGTARAKRALSEGLGIAGKLGHRRAALAVPDAFDSSVSSAPPQPSMLPFVGFSYSLLTKGKWRSMVGLYFPSKNSSSFIAIFGTHFSIYDFFTHFRPILQSCVSISGWGLQSKTPSEEGKYMIEP